MAGKSRDFHTFSMASGHAWVVSPFEMQALKTKGKTIVFEQVILGLTRMQKGLLFSRALLSASVLVVPSSQPCRGRFRGLDRVHFCAPFDYEEWRRDHPRPAGKRATLPTVRSWCKTRPIRRANVDGSNVQDLVNTEGPPGGGIALDVAGGKIYGAEYNFQTDTLPTIPLRDTQKLQRRSVCRGWTLAPIYRGLKPDTRPTGAGKRHEPRPDA